MTTVSINGNELFYTTVGQGQPCLIMHGGLGFDHTYLHPWLDPLGDILELVYYDHRGNGRSGRPPKETMTHAQFAADADALVTHLGYDKAAVLGHSYGGFIALEFALRYPQRVSHLILLESVAVFDHHEEVITNAIRNGATEEILALLQGEFSPDEEIADQFYKIMPVYFKNFEADIARQLMENMIIELNGNAAEGELEAYNVVPRLGEIEVPTLILVGRHDFICPPSKARQLHDGLPNSELIIFENSGHFPYVEERPLFFKTIKNWFNHHS